MQQTIKDRAFLVIRYGKPSPPLGRKTCMIGTRLFSPGGLGGLEILLWMQSGQVKIKQDTSTPVSLA
jgi:hypothetical protein